MKLTPDGLIGTWLGKVNGGRLPLSVPRPPVEKDKQLDIYQGEATIGTLARFTIGEAGLSAVVALEHSDGATYGTLRPAENGALRLTLTRDELRVPDAGIALTRDADGTSTKLRHDVR